jgi:hypothetical protein
MKKMGGLTGRQLGAALIAGTVITSLVGLSSPSVSGVSNEATDPVLSPFGTLTVELGDREGAIRLDLVDGSRYTQPLVTQQPCAQVGFGAVAPSSSSAGNLLTLNAIVGGRTTPADTVQLPDDALGVNTGENCGAPAGLIGPSELLEIGLGPFFEQFRSEPSTPAVFARSAGLAIDKKFNNDGSLTVGYDGGEQGSPIAIRTGGQAVGVQPAELFNSVTIGSTSTKDSRGLSVGSLTTFDLVAVSADFEVAVDCGEQVTEIGGDGEIATSAVFFRGENDPDKQVGPCDQVGVIVEIESDDPATTEREDSVYWDNSVEGVNTGDPQAVNGTVTIVWAPSPVSEVGNPTQIDYDADGPAVYTDALWCESFSSSVDMDGKVTFDAELPTYTGPGANPDDTAPWCLVSSSDVLNGDGTVTRTQQFFGSGDPRAQY